MARKRTVAGASAALLLVGAARGVQRTGDAGGSGGSRSSSASRQANNGDVWRTNQTNVVEELQAAMPRRSRSRDRRSGDDAKQSADVDDLIARGSTSCC